MSNVKGFHRCEKTSSRPDCRAWATVYAVDSGAGGWGGRYCPECAEALGWQILDRYAIEIEEPRPYGPDPDAEAVLEMLGMEMDGSSCSECEAPVGECLDVSYETGHDIGRWHACFYWPDGTIVCEDCAAG